MENDIKHTRNLTGWQLQAELTHFITYAWIKGDKWLYVGQSLKGIKVFNNHKVIGKELPLQETDEIKIWHFDNLQEMLGLEAKLIINHNPLFNLKFADERITTKQSICVNCHEPFYPLREWQKYCTPDCREEGTKKKIEKNKAEMRNCVHCKAEYVLTAADAMMKNPAFCPVCRPLVVGD